MKRLFIANRGEIARRIALTAHRLGIETVVLTDQETPPAYLIGIVTTFVQVPEESPALYLDGDLMVAKATQAGCDSVHPGFGFLSENAGFAAKVEQAGLIWVGPTPAAIEAMASKAAARTRAEQAGVPCVMGLSGFPVPADEHGDFSVLEGFAGKAGYPLLIKASYGGGGKGMRLVHKLDELRPAALRATSEAKHAFGDGSLICEQYLTTPRHVEVQILADRHGHVVAVGDRDCSVQRRHQKIIEEAPAPALTDATRQALHQAAVSLAAAVGYDNAGTVEFLVDWAPDSRGARLQRFFFLEMNTRLQVEHPVSEEVYGLDLVEWQLRVAQDEPLPAAFSRLEPRGHSVEVRLYAEDTRQNFFPSPGPVAAFKPATGPGIRWEIGLDEVGEITGRFDPMFAKLVATGATRTVALARLADALARTFFAGPAANLEFLREIVAHSTFAEEPVTTHFLGEAMTSLLQGMDARREQVAGLAERLLDRATEGRLGQAGGVVRQLDVAHLTQAIFSSRERAAAPQTSEAQAPVRLALGEQLETPHLREPTQLGHGLALDTDAQLRPFWYAALKSGSDRQFWVQVDGCLFGRTVAKASAHGAEAEAQGASEILAPVPGKVIAVKTSVGATVAAGDSVLVLESMKMEFEVRAVQAGRIGAINVKEGDQVASGQLLATWAE